MRNSDKCCNPHHGHPPASSRISNQHKILKNVVFYFSYRHAGSRPQVPLVHTFSLRLSSPGLFQSQGLPSFCTCSHTHSKSTDDEPACPCPHTHLIFHVCLFQIQENVVLGGLLNSLKKGQHP